jgi:hypothetical protein
MRGPISSWSPRTVDSVQGGLADLPAVARRVREEAVNLRLPLKQDGGLRCANLPWRCFWPKGTPVALSSLTAPRFVSICRVIDTWPNGRALCFVTDRHARFRPFSKNRSTDEGAEPSVSRSYVHRQKGISLCIRQLCSRLTGKLPAAPMTSSTRGAGNAS